MSNSLLTAPTPRAVTSRCARLDSHRAHPCRSADRLRTSKSHLAAMEDLLTFAMRTRMPNLLLVRAKQQRQGQNHRKVQTWLIAGRARSLRRCDSVPVLNVQMPPGPDERRFSAAALEALGAPDRNNERLAARAGHGDAHAASNRCAPARHRRSALFTVTATPLPQPAALTSITVAFLGDF